MTPLAIADKRNFLIEKARRLLGIDVYGKDRCRKRDYVYVRQSICKILHDDGHSLASVGRMFHQNHSTVLLGIQSVESALSIKGSNEMLKGIYTSLIQDWDPQQPEITVTTTKAMLERWITSVNIDSDTVEKLMHNLDRYVESK